MKRNIVSIGIGCSMLLLVNCKKDKDTVAPGNLLGEWTQQSAAYSYQYYKNGVLIEEGTQKNAVIEKPDKITFSEDSTYKIVRASGTTRSSGTFSYIKSKKWLLLKRSTSNTDTLTLMQLTSNTMSTQQTDDDTYTSEGVTHREVETEALTYKR